MKINIRIGVINFLIGVAGGIVGAAGIFLFYAPAQVPPIGTANITAIVDQYVKGQIEKKSSPEAQQAQIRGFGHRLEIVLREIAHKEHVVLLPSEAVIAGARDYTQELQQQLNSSAIEP